VASARAAGEGKTSEDQGRAPTRHCEAAHPGLAASAERLIICCIKVREAAVTNTQNRRASVMMAVGVAIGFLVGVLAYALMQ
jgi:hypothetical protein